MKVTLQNTSKIVEVNGIPAWIWEGETESGIKMHAFISRVAIDENEPRDEEFKTELMQVSAPSVKIEAYPLKMIL